MDVDALAKWQQVGVEGDLGALINRHHFEADALRAFTCDGDVLGLGDTADKTRAIYT